MLSETEAEINARLSEAEAAHHRRLEGAKIHASQIQTFSSDAMKAPALVAMGGVVTLLGFYSANYERLKASQDAMTTFGDMLFWLFTSLLLTVSAPGLAYLSQIAYIESLYSEDHFWESPYVRDNRRSLFSRRAGVFCDGLQ